MAQPLESLSEPGAATLSPALGAEAPTLPKIRIRGRNFMALVLAPECPMAAWFSALDAQMRGVGDLFGDRPVVVDLAAALAEGPEAPAIILDGLEARGLRLVAVEGVDRRLLSARWARLATTLAGREMSLEPRADPPDAGQAEADAPRPLAPSLLIDRPVRSGQSIVFEDGDVTIVGPVASGAEVIAGGSIHIYGALRGRAIAGLRPDGAARIFCRRLEAELVGIDRLYRTAEHWGATLHGRAVQVFCDRGALRLAAFD